MEGPEISPIWSLLPLLEQIGLVIETITMTSATSQLVHIETHLCTSVIAIGFMIATLDITNHSFKWNIDITNSARFIFIVEVDSFPSEP